MLRPAFRIVATALTLAVLTLTLHGQSPVRYVYDELGRLVAVIDGNGDTAVYAYDAVGNMIKSRRGRPGARITT